MVYIYLAVAVSGGVDSMSLAVLANNYFHRDSCQGHGHHAQVYAITVDHSLRPNSGEEAQQVSKNLESIYL